MNGRGLKSMVLVRLLQLPFILLAIYTITFMLIWVIPGNPLEKPEGRRPPDEIVEAMQSRYNLDDPVAFYVDYLAGVTGVDWALGTGGPMIDFGPSLRHENWSVNEILATQLPVSILLGLTSISWPA